MYFSTFAHSTGMAQSYKRKLQLKFKLHMFLAIWLATHKFSANQNAWNKFSVNCFTNFSFQDQNQGLRNLQVFGHEIEPKYDCVSELKFLRGSTFESEIFQISSKFWIRPFLPFHLPVIFCKL